MIERTRAFSVNLLRDGQADIAARFAGMTGLKGEQASRAATGPCSRPARR